MTLCDTGPLVALIDRSDANHRRCLAELSSLPPEPLLTTWPCLTEAMYLLARVGGVPAQDELWGYLTDGLVQLYMPADGEWSRMHELMNRYSDMPLDFADASLVSAAERLGIRVLFSIDQPLRAVRLLDGESLNFIP